MPAPTRRIVATIGPASENPEILKNILPHLGIARMNFSHGSHAEHEAKIHSVRELDPAVKILIDLQGPKIRVGKFPGGAVEYKKGERTHIVLDPARLDECDRMHLFVAVPELLADTGPGDVLLFNDGYLAARILEKRDAENRLFIEFLNGGKLSSNKGINSSTASLSTSPLTEKDLRDLDFAAQMQPDFVALSFVRDAGDVRDLREKMAARGLENSQIIVKIERHEALAKIDEICAAADVVMIARGDLAVEIEQTDLPRAQFQILDAAHRAGKPVIWATQVLESMAENPRPTRAELTDLHTAITRGADLTMLSAETATGIYPVETVELMAKMWEKYGAAA